MIPEPLLGLATTRELLTEVATRMEITQNSIKGRDLGVLCRAIDFERELRTLLEHYPLWNAQAAGETN